MKRILLLLALALAACEESQSTKDIRAERQLTGKAKQQREEYYRTSELEYQEAKRTGSGGSTTGLGSR